MYLPCFEPYIYKPNGAINYNRPLNGLRSRQISQLYIKDGAATKSCKFVYNPTTEQRLNLLKINTYDENPNTGGILISSYGFGYYNFDKLPDYLSKAVDHWGYYNGTPYTVPTSTSVESAEFQRQVDTFVSQRRTDENYVKYGILSMITYPTGATSEMTFGAHRYTSVVADDRQSIIQETGVAGGLRIQGITEYDNQTSILGTKTYSYSEEINQTVSSGQLAATPRYYWYRWESDAVDPKAKAWVTTFRASSIIPLSNTFGPHIGYTYIMENKTTDAASVVYKYQNFSDIYDDPPLLYFTNTLVSPDTKFSESSHRRGKLLEERYYKYYFTPVKKVIYTYRTDIPENTYYVLTSNVKINYGMVSGGNTYYSGGVTRLYYPRYDVIRTQEQFIENNAIQIQTTRNYTRADKVLTVGTGRTINIRTLASESFVSSNNTTITIQYKFPYDLSDSYMSNLTQAFRIGKPIVINKLIGGQAAGSEKTKYAQFGSKIAPSVYQTSRRGESTLEDNVVFTGYDDYGNLTSTRDKAGKTTVFVWGKNKRNELSAVVENAATLAEVTQHLNTNVLYKSSGDSGDDFITEFNKVRKALPTSRITNYTYTKGKSVTSITDPSGLTNRYAYDRHGRLITERDPDNNQVSSYSYNYSKDQALLVRIINDYTGSAVLGAPIQFTAIIGGGSDDYNIQWTLTGNGDTPVYDTATNVRTFATTAYAGYLNVACNVTDRQTGKSKRISTIVTPIGTSCGFKDIVYYANNDVAGYINMPFADTMVLTARNPVGFGTLAVQVGGSSYLLAPYETRTITVTTQSNNQRLAFRMYTSHEVSQNGIQSSIYIERLQNNTTVIDTANRSIYIPRN